MSTRPGLHTSARPQHRLVALFAALFLGVFGLVAPAQAEDIAETYVVAGSVAADGTLQVTETITFATAAPDKLEQRLATTRQLLDYTQLNYEITDIKAEAGGADLAPTISQDGDYTVITIDGTKAGAEPIVISYSVKGAAVGLPQVGEQPRMTEVSWRVLQGLSVAVKQVSGEIQLPQGARTNDINCQAGPPSNTVSCKTYASGTFEATYPQFTDGPRGQGEVVILSFSLPQSAVAVNQNLTQRWTLDRAFSAAPLPLGLALGALALGAGALYLLHRTRGLDATGTPTLVARFEPVAAGEERFTLVEKILPGEVGTLADERVDPVDIAATVVDLAQRGHLRIVELPKSSQHAPTDWTFERLSGGEGELHDYERTLLDALAPEGGEAATVSSIGGTIAGVVDTVQDQIYTEVVKEGWFAARPDDVRSNWGRIGLAAVLGALVVLGLLVAFTNFGLLGLVLVGLAVGLITVASQMPRRTAKGASILKGLQGLALSLVTQPIETLPKANAHQEISRVLPYAIVLGGTDRWLQAMVDADEDADVPDPDDLAWYRAPETGTCLTCPARWTRSSPRWKASWSAATDLAVG